MTTRFIDIHTHAYRIAPPPLSPGQKETFPTAEQMLARFDELGVETGVLLPLIGPEVYSPQTNEEMIEMAAKYPGRFIPFCNIHPMIMSNSADAPLDYLLNYYKDRGCRGIGEVMMNMPFLDPMVQNLFKHTEAVGFPLTIDMSTRIGHGYGLYDDPGLPQLEECLRRFPRLNILGHGPPFWAEISVLKTPEERAGYPKGPVLGEGAAVRLLRKYPNLWGDLAAGSGYNALARDVEFAVKFIHEFQDKLLFGMDICSPTQHAPLPGFLKDLLAAGRISQDIFDKIARRNAIRLLGL